MKKYLIILCIIILNIFTKDITFADSITSSLTWTDSSWIKNCSAASSHWISHEWIPAVNWTVVSVWTSTCNNHNYYPSSPQYTKTFTANSWVNTCDAWDKIISIAPSPCTSWTCTITCKKYNDIVPLVSATNSSSTIWKNTNISINLNVSVQSWWNNIVQSRYSWTAGDLSADCTTWWANYTNWQVITNTTEGARTLYLCSIDEAWNIWTWAWIYKLDKTLPIVSATNSSSTIWKNTNISITLSANWTVSAVSQARYSWTAGDLSADCTTWWANYTNWQVITNTTEGARTLYLCSIDEAWNIWTWAWIYKLDKTLPIVSATNSSSTIWKNTNISITLSANWTVSAVSQARYSWNVGDLSADCTTWWTNYTNWQVIINSTEGTRTLYLCSIDEAWNIWTWSRIYKLDKTLPIVSATNSSSTDIKNSDIYVNLSFTSTDILLSPLVEARYTWTTWGLSSDCTTWWFIYLDNRRFILSTDWTRTLYLCGRDSANNVQTWSWTYILDKSVVVIPPPDPIPDPIRTWTWTTDTWTVNKPKKRIIYQELLKSINNDWTWIIRTK